MYSLERVRGDERLELFGKPLFITKLTGELRPDQMKEDLVLRQAKSDEIMAPAGVPASLVENLGAVVLLPFALITSVQGSLILVLVFFVFVLKSPPSTRKQMWLVAGLLVVAMDVFFPVIPMASSTMVKNLGFPLSGAIVAAVTAASVILARRRFRATTKPPSK
jgi:hypothetical protein